MKNFLTAFTGSLVITSCGEIPEAIKRDKTAQEGEKRESWKQAEQDTGQDEVMAIPPSQNLLKTWTEGEIAVALFRASMALKGIQAKIRQLEQQRSESGLNQDEKEWLEKLKKSLKYYEEFLKQLDEEYRKRMARTIEI